MENYFSVIKNASKAVPFLKYAVGLAGIAALIALVKSYGLDYDVAIWGGIIVLILMIILFLLSKAYHSSNLPLHKLAYFLICSMTSLFVLTAILLVTCTFFDLPKPIMQVLHPSKFEESSKPAPKPDVAKIELPDSAKSVVTPAPVVIPQATPPIKVDNSGNNVHVVLKDSSKVGTIINGDSHTIHITQTF